MRLDKYLVTRGFFTTRQKAKEAIRMGHVTVNGRIVTKPSTDVEPSSIVNVISEERPKGYWKLAKLDRQWNLIKEGDIVLDIGSSSGGFLLYASEKAARVYGIEFSREFENALREIEKEKNNVRVFVEDAFTFDTSRLEPIDLILNDLTLNAESSFKALLHFLPLLKENGKILFVKKTGIEDRHLKFERGGLRVVNRIDSEEKKERYYLLCKL
jgi:23S rRNA (cytidine1920-2'-O)/16S rRNA (cytidine1409-2'-O)-methyltransferase